ncbi:MAG: response regulator [Acidobacteriota bacterium]
MHPRVVLVAEHDPVQQWRLDVRLTQAGYVVFCVRDGVEALEEARHSVPDVVVAGVSLARLDGFKLCRALKQDPGLRSIPVVLMSAGPLREAARRLAWSGGANALVEPTRDGEAVLEAVRASLAEGPPRLSEGTESLLADLRGEFLRQGLVQVRRLGARLDDAAAKRTARRWEAVGATLGLWPISQRARALEMLLEDPRQHRPRIRLVLEEIARLFAGATSAGQGPPRAAEDRPAAAEPRQPVRSAAARAG